MNIWMKSWNKHLNPFQPYTKYKIVKVLYNFWQGSWLDKVLGWKRHCQVIIRTCQTA